jgi:hypothetical protein
LARRSREAACFRTGAVFFADPFLAVGAAARFAGFATVRLFGAARRFCATFSIFSALTGVAAFEVVFVFAWTAAAVTFSTFLGGDTFVAFIITLADETAGGGAETGGATAADAAFVLPFGRPPFLANCASANILRKASCASAIS